MSRAIKAGTHPRQPVFDWMARQGLGYVWLARATGISHGHVKNVAAGIFPATADFRAKVAEAVKPFGLPESVLFHPVSAEPDQEPTRAA